MSLRCPEKEIREITTSLDFEKILLSEHTVNPLCSQYSTIGAFHDLNMSGMH
jgi:hypothetical protein